MTALSSKLADRLSEYAAANEARLASIVADLVRIPSENKSPHGAEGACQAYVSAFLERLGYTPRVYRPDAVPGVTSHPLYWPGRDYAQRPNVSATRAGAGGGGKSLLLSGHIDTVPAGTQPWTRDPFSGHIQDGRLYGRGAVDMKGGVGTALFVLEAMNALGIATRGDLMFETVVDEEFGGCNGTLAGRLASPPPDAAMIMEPSFLRICAGQRGGRTAHITLEASAGGVLTEGMFPRGIADQLREFLVAVDAFAAQRNARVTVHPLYSGCPDPVPVSITKVYTGPWGTGEPTTVPERCQVEMYWQTMPGETVDAVDAEFFEWLATLSFQPQVTWPIRWLPGSALDSQHALVTTLSDAAKAQLGARPRVTGIEGPCDLFVFHEFGIPAVLWGASGGNIHAADEYLDLYSATQAAAVLLRFICEWCGAVE